MPLSIEGRPDQAQAVRTVHAALDAGITLLDTADAYCLGPDEVGHNERLLARALATWSGDRDSVVIATKGGHTRPPDGSWALDGSREHLRAACEASLTALGVESIGLHQFHRPDPQVLRAESVGALEELRQEGKTQLVGVSNADPAQSREVASITSLAAVQNELSPRFRSSEPEVELSAHLGVAFLPWSPLGGIAQAGELGSVHGTFARVAAERGVSPQQVCLAWLLARSSVVLPDPGRAAGRVDPRLGRCRRAGAQRRGAGAARPVLTTPPLQSPTRGGSGAHAAAGEMPASRPSPEVATSPRMQPATGTAAQLTSP